MGKGREFLGSIINSFLFLNSSLICVYETAHSLQKNKLWEGEGISYEAIKRLKKSRVGGKGGGPINLLGRPFLFGDKEVELEIFVGFLGLVTHSH